MSDNSKSIERIAWLDVCKGLCIILVVYGHVAGGLEASGTLAESSLWIAIRQWVYLFHMPAFFVLSGILAPKLSQLSPREFLLGRLKTVFYPYVIWTAVIVGSQFLMARFVNNPPNFSQAMRFLVEPYGYGLWFLYGLFIISLVFYFLMRYKIPVCVLFLLAVILSLLSNHNAFWFWPIFNISMGYFIYYAVAGGARDRIISLFSANHWAISLLFGVVALLAMTFLYLEKWGGGYCYSLLLAWLGIFGVVSLSKGLAQTLCRRFFAFLGMFSLEIYLGHPLWGTISRVILLHSKTSSPLILVFGGVFLGIAGSLAVGFLCRAGKFPYLFKWPTKVAVKS